VLSTRHVQPNAAPARAVGPPVLRFDSAWEVIIDAFWCTALCMLSMTGCAGLDTREIVKTTGVLGCAPEPLTPYQVQLIQEFQKSYFSGGTYTLSYNPNSLSETDRKQMVGYFTRCGNLDPQTGASVLPRSP
jgi:hypothetical protein